MILHFPSRLRSLEWLLHVPPIGDRRYSKANTLHKNLFHWLIDVNLNSELKNSCYLQFGSKVIFTIRIPGKWDRFGQKQRLLLLLLVDQKSLRLPDSWAIACNSYGQKTNRNWWLTNFQWITLECQTRDSFAVTFSVICSKQYKCSGCRPQGWLK